MTIKFKGIYAVSLLAVRPMECDANGGPQESVRHDVHVIRAIDIETAIGISRTLLKKQFPSKDQWGRRQLAVKDVFTRTFRYEEISADEITEEPSPAIDTDQSAAQVATWPEVIGVV